MWIGEQLRDRGPGAPVRPGGGSWAPALIALTLVIASGGIFLAPQIWELSTRFWDTKAQPGKSEPVPERPSLPSAGGRGAERAQAISSPASWITNDDYPEAALHKGEQGSVGIEFTVARNGRISDCEVVHSSGSRLLDRTTCNLVTERALYSPALDAQGRAIEQTSRLRFRWQIAE